MPEKKERKHSESRFKAEVLLHTCDKVVIDYIKASPAVVSLLICLAFKPTHMHAHRCTHTHTHHAHSVTSHQSGNNILLRRPFTAHSHKSLRQNHHPYCQHANMHTHMLAPMGSSRPTSIHFAQSSYLA